MFSFFQQKSQQNQGQQQAASGQQQNNQGQQPPNGQQQGNANADPNASQSGQSSNPADIYSKMWENGTNATEAPRLRLDSKVLDEVSGKMDFMQGIDPNLVQKATSGDVQSLMQLMGQVAQKSYRASIEHSSALTDGFINQRESFNEARTGSAVKSELLMQDLFKGKDGKPLPDYAKKQIADIAKRMQQSSPDATPQEIAASVRDYIKSFAGMVTDDDSSNGQQNAALDGQQNQPFDWDKWANS